MIGIYINGWRRTPGARKTREGGGIRRKSNRGGGDEAAGGGTEANSKDADGRQRGISEKR